MTSRARGAILNFELSMLLSCSQAKPHSLSPNPPCSRRLAAGGRRLEDAAEKTARRAGEDRGPEEREGSGEASWSECVDLVDVH